MMSNIKQYQLVKYIGLSTSEISHGDIGCVIEVYPGGNFEVEFSLPDGTTYAQVVLTKKELVPVSLPDSNRGDV